MPDRIIFHADCNNFYASCEILENPSLRDVPMAVAGDPEDRVGIVVAKNEIAKRYGVKTTDTVYTAKQKCPGIVFVPPRHHYYSTISHRVNEIYLRYTDYVEPASIDESYLDMTGYVASRTSHQQAGSGDAQLLETAARAVADELRDRVRSEIGITISVGVSYCKIFAKMGSDYKKPDATTVITRENYKTLLWPLQVGELYMAGKAAVEKMNKHYIRTIGDLAKSSVDTLHDLLGKHGDLLWRYANGIDEESVRQYGDRPEIKSVSRGRTFKRDLLTVGEVKTSISVLADEVARELRRHSMKGEVVTVMIRRPDMSIISRQTQLGHFTFLQREIQETAFDLVQTHWRIGDPIRALTVGVGKLAHEDAIVEQIDMFDGLLSVAPLGPGDGQKGMRGTTREKQEKLETLMDELRHKHGEKSITLGYQENKDIGITRGEGKR